MTDSELVDYIVAMVHQDIGTSRKFPHPMSDVNLIDLPKRAAVKSELVKNHQILIHFRPTETVIGHINADMNSNPRRDRTKHTFEAPPFHEDVKRIMMDVVPYNLWFYGPSATGKTRYTKYLAVEVGNELYGEAMPVFQINGRADMDTNGFLGDRTIEIDEKSQQNKIVVKEGPVVKAMTCGLDSNGEPTKKGSKNFVPPAILFVDEAAALPPHIAISLNRLLETDNPRREVALDFDGGRVIHSHPGFRVICAANTIGRGIMSGSDALYTAQANALDISTLNRMTATFRFGYNRKAEEFIMREKIGDASKIESLIKLRDAIRTAIQKKERISTPFTTRDIVSICNLYRVWNNLPKAIYYGVMTKLPPEEVAPYNDICRLICNSDILETIAKTNDMDFMD